MYLTSIKFGHTCKETCHRVKCLGPDRISAVLDYPFNGFDEVLFHAVAYFKFFSERGGGF